MPFQTLGLKAELVRAVGNQGYDQPTPIQAQSIPVILEGRDVIGRAQTGTGKTAAFTLPLLQRLGETTPQGGHRRPRALVLTPTRELAMQVEESVKTYGRHSALKSAAIFGGVGMAPQVQALRRGVDIVVATPGRLLDHAGQRTLDLSRVEILVLDEADRMLDMGFIHDIRRIMGMLPSRRQNLLFSATMPDEIVRLVHDFMRSPVTISITPSKPAAELVEQLIHPVDRDRKRDLLIHLIRTEKWEQALVFCRTKHGADRLAQQLGRAGVNAAPIHGDRTQGQRTKALKDFKNGRVRVLVATDIAARGLDIDQLPHVVNFDLPNVPEDYVHRIGRTGRAGNEGIAISLVSSDESEQLRDIERLLKRELPRKTIEGFEPKLKIASSETMAARPKRFVFSTHPRGRAKRTAGRPCRPRVRD